MEDTTENSTGNTTKTNTAAKPLLARFPHKEPGHKHNQRMENTTERGRPGGITPVGFGKDTSKYMVDPLDYNYELRFPHSIPIYDQVRSDGQVEAVLEAVRLPILAAQWDLHTEGVRPEVVDLVRTELGLTAPGQGQAGRRRRQGIVWKEHLEQVLTMLWAGFMCFEQVYEVGPAAPGQENTGLEDVIHLRKLAPRLPRTIERINTGRDGGLASITQTGTGMTPSVDIPVTQLVFYTRKREGADWSGRSLLRAAYKNWLIKDALIRLDAQAAERNSMGIPVVYYAQPDQEETALSIATELRAGATAGVALKKDELDLVMKGVQGSVADLLPKIAYHDQQMAKSALAMFIDLGHDNGARSLGETFASLFTKSLQNTAEYIATVATEHIIRDLVELNYGPDEAYPVMTPGDLQADQGITVESLKMLVDAGVVQGDDALEAFERRRHGLPDKDHSTARTTPATAPAGGFSLVTNHEATQENQDDITAMIEQVRELREARAKARRHV